VNEQELVREALRFGWRISPLSAALTFSAWDHVEGVSQDAQFESAPHLELVSDAIVDGVNGDGPQYIIVSMPPRHGKSTLISKWTPEWYLGNWPQNTVGVCGYGGEFAQQWGRSVRNQMDRHEDILGFKLAEDSQKANVWNTAHGGGMWAAGIRGSITGRGANLMVVDDPIKNEEEAFNSGQRDKLWEWWQGTALTRTYPSSVIVVVMTRWHSDDLVGRLLSAEHCGNPEDWRVIELPAIWDKKGVDAIGRKTGEALWPSHFPADWLIKHRQKAMQPEFWEALYQQRPMNETGVGVVYKNFDESIHVREIHRDHRLPLSLSLDFNVNPMTGVIAQVREEFTAHTHLTNEKRIVCEVLDEKVLPDSNTPEMMAEFFDWYKDSEGSRRTEVWVYGDATANRRDTRGDLSDWEIVYRFLRDHSIPFKTFVTKSDPTQRARANAMNDALQLDDDVRLFLRPRCKELREDLKEVRWKKDKAGNTMSQLDKSNPKRTHVSDALGYLVFSRFALAEAGGERPGTPR